MSKTYLEKEQKLIQRLHDTNYEIFGGDKDEAFDTLGKQLQSFSDYINIVIHEKVMMSIWKAHLEPEDLKEHIMDIDRRRKNRHDVAIDSVNILNRLSKNLGLEPFAEVDTTDRRAVAEFVGQYISQLYKHGIG